MNETQNEEQLRFPDDIMEEGGNLAGRIEAILFVAGEAVRVEDLSKALDAPIREVEDALIHATSMTSISAAFRSNATGIRCSWRRAHCIRRMWCGFSSPCRSSHFRRRPWRRSRSWRTVSRLRAPR